MPPETLGSRPGSVVTGRDREVHGATHNWPSGLGRVWPVGKSLSHCAPATPVAGLGAVRTNQGCQVHGVSSDTLVRLASGLDGAVLRSSAAWLGCVSEDA